MPNLSHPDIWLELETNDTEAAASFLKIHGVSRRDEVEQLREDFNGLFISAPMASFISLSGRRKCELLIDMTVTAQMNWSLHAGSTLTLSV